MEVEQLLAAVRARAPWRYGASLILKSCGLHVGHGFDDTYGNLLQPGVISEDANQALEDRLIEHMISGEKSLRLFNKNTAIVDALIQRGAGRRSAHPLANTFPAVVSEQELAQYGDVPPKFCAYFERPEGHALLFVGARSYQERIVLAPEDLKASAAHQREFESIIGIVNRRRVVHDAIWIPHDHDFIIVAADYPKSATSEFPSASHISIERSMHRLSGVEPDTVNFWPAVSGLYFSEEGEVVELGFVTDDASVKHMKARQGKGCLRKDAYHAAGSEEVGENLEPFRLAVTWTRQEAENVITHPELMLPGTSRHIFAPGQPLLDAIFRNGLNVRDLSLVLSKLAPHL